MLGCLSNLILSGTAEACELGWQGRRRNGFSSWVTRNYYIQVVTWKTYVSCRITLWRPEFLEMRTVGGQWLASVSRGQNLKVSRKSNSKLEANVTCLKCKAHILGSMQM